MADLSPVYELVARLLPLEAMQARFMQRALVGLVLLAPMAAAMGVHVVSFRMAFFADAISHSAFAGIALGLILAVAPTSTMVAFGVLLGLGIMLVHRRSPLSADTVIGVFFSGAVAFGLAVVSRDRTVARDMQRLLYGDVLTLSDGEIAALAGLFAAHCAFLVLSFNRLLYLGVNSALAQTHRVRVAAYQYSFATLLSLVVMVSVRAVGVLLVTAMMIVPAAAARNVARSAGGMFWWAVLIGLSSALAGLLVSAQPWARTATGATVVLCSCVWFVATSLVARARRQVPGSAS